MRPIETLEDSAPTHRRSWGELPLSIPLNLSWAVAVLTAIAFLPIHDLPPMAWVVWGIWILLNVGLTALALRGREVPLDSRPRASKSGEIRGTSLFRDAMRRLGRNQLATLSGGILVLMVILCFGQSLIALVVQPEAGDLTEAGGQTRRAELESSFWSIHFDHARVNEDEAFQPPSARHWFGTDFSGRDLFARTLYGGTISFLVALVATVVSLVIGVSWGAVSGFLGGKLDHYLMRIVDVLYGLPFMFLIILIMTLVNGVSTTAGQNRDIIRSHDEALARGETERARTILVEADIESSVETVRAAIWLDDHVSPIFIMFVAIGLVSWLTMARITRGQVLSLKQREFIVAARTIGASSPRIIFLHLVPNLLGPVIIYTTLTIPSVMLTEAFLSFLGLGISEPECSWGSLASGGWNELNVIKPYWWLVTYPTAAMFLTLFSLNFIGDGLRDALDPKMKR